MALKRKTLPKDFAQMLQSASFDELTAVFRTRLIDARGGYGKTTAIGFLECPDELIEWLVAQGLDVDAADSYDATPLWERASMGWHEQIPLLLSLGADIERRRRGGATPLHGAAGWHRVAAVRVLLDHGADPLAATDRAGETALLYALRRTRNADIVATVELAALLLGAGDSITSEMRDEVARIGREFEMFRASFNAADLDPTEAALHSLYALFEVQPARPRVVHDGISPIDMPPGSWQDQHEALWELLVPTQGAATTVQGEVIRVTGRIANEILGNGAVNWDRDFTTMLGSIVKQYATGAPLSAAELAETARLVSALRSGDADAESLNRLSELAVTWVSQNPSPIALPEVSYKR